MTGFDPTAGMMTADTGGPPPVPAAITEIMRAPESAVQYLVEIDAFFGGRRRPGGDVIAPTGALATADLPPGAAVAGGVVETRLGDRHWRGHPDDPTRANRLYEGRVRVPLVWEWQAPLEPEDGARAQTAFGEIEIANGDGALDGLVAEGAVDGRRVTVRRGPVMGRGHSTDFLVAIDAVAVAWEGDDATLRLQLRDHTYTLELPLQTETYEGTGGLEGTEDLAGKPKPLLFGRCRNVTPVAVDPTVLLYQAHDGPMLAVDGVFDRGVALPLDADYPDPASLMAASIPDGFHATCLAHGLIRLGAPPDGLVTADARGDAEPFYADRLDTIALRILIDRAGVPAGRIATSTFAGAGALGGEMGLFIGHAERPTTSEVVSRLMGAVAGWWGQDRQGRIRAGRLTAPERQPPVMTLGPADIIAIERLAWLPPRWRVRAAWRPNWTPQQLDLAEGVTPERRQFLAEADRVVESHDLQVRIRHREARDPEPLRTFYEHEQDAKATTDFLMELLGEDRALWSVTVKRIGWRAAMGRAVQVRYPRFELAQGRRLLVVGIREDADREETRLTLWG